MSAKIRLELENKTGKGWNELEASLKKIAGETGKVEDASEQLNQEFQKDAAARQAKQIKELADETLHLSRMQEIATSQASMLRQELENRAVQRMKEHVKQLADAHEGLTKKVGDARKAIDWSSVATGFNSSA